jgi:hypoxanthine-guanine phosphoribosyltransferase
MKTILLYLESLNPKSVKIASLLYKSKSVVKPNYFCFEVFTDSWLIGYGLDDKLKKRNLTDIFEIIN